MWCTNAAFSTISLPLDLFRGSSSSWLFVVSFFCMLCLSSGSYRLHQTFPNSSQVGKGGRSHTAVMCQWSCYPLSPFPRLALTFLSSDHILCDKIESPSTHHALIKPKGYILIILISLLYVRWKSHGRSWVYVLCLRTEAESAYFSA